MCGIAGIVAGTHRSVEELEALASAMAEAVVHRGPDDVGSWVDPRGSVAFGHRRLSILDLSPSGAQPMRSHCGRFVIAFNGEIYNHAALRRKLKARRFRGHSDTEVLLAAISEWTVDGALPMLNGMFAFAVWDEEQRVLTLARDRIGEKPLYYGFAGADFIFGSELKALCVHPRFNTSIDTDALAELLRLSYVPAPHSIYTGILKLLPGHTVRVKVEDRPRVAGPVRYWSLDAKEPAREPPEREELVQELEELLCTSVRLRMVADVPVGAFLSGGIDSSTVAALMQSQSSHPIKTFSISFNEREFNEARHARRVADALGTSHAEFAFTPEDALALVPELPLVYDEPFADTSQLPTMLLCRVARHDVTVALSGDGGDELFGGYRRYKWAVPVWRVLSLSPSSGRRVAAEGLEALSRSRHLPRRPRTAAQIGKAARIARARDFDDFQERIVSLQDVAGPAPSNGAVQRSLGDRMLLADTRRYLPDDILVKVDRASMAVSLECRLPLLDHRIAEWAWRLPASTKLRGRRGKWLLRGVLEKHLPPALYDRPKQGFGVPLARWLRGPLKEWTGDLLASRRLGDNGLIDSTLVQHMWNEHRAGIRDWHDQLWPVLMFEAWRDKVAAAHTPSSLT
jgi:asparagine synthase (glutamine-hydrolysing)